MPAGQYWSLSGVQILGLGGANAFGTLAIYPDAGGVPAGAPVRSASGATTGINQFSLPLRALLDPGHYWFAVESLGDWKWQTQSPQSGNEAVWDNAMLCPPGGWRTVSSCGQPGPDLTFSLNGHVISNQFTFGAISRKSNGNVYVNVKVEDKGVMGWQDSKGFVKAIPEHEISNTDIEDTLELKTEKSLRSKLKKKHKTLKTDVTFTFKPPAGPSSSQTIPVAFKAKHKKKKGKGKTKKTK